MESFTERERLMDAVAWPRSISDLTRTDVCPACQRSLESTVCGYCGLDLRHPASVDLISMSLRAADALDQRLVIIRRVRADTLAAAARDVAAQLDKASPRDDEHWNDPREPTSAPQLAFPPQPPASARSHQPDFAPPSDLGFPPPTAPPHRPARSGVSSIQVALLIAGVSLLSAGAVAFLVYAFLNYGIVWRSVIIATVTLAAFAAATVLLRRRLRATAEGIAIFAVVLIYLDAWAIRTNDFFGTGSTDPSLFWGVTIVASSVLFVAWSRSTLATTSEIERQPRGTDTATRRADAGWLRAPHLIGWGALPVGAALIAVALTPDEVTGEAFFVFATVTAIGLAHPLVQIRRSDVVVRAGVVERVLLLAAAVLSVLPALIAALYVGQQDVGFSVDSDASFTPGAPAAAIAAVVVLSALHILVASRSRSTPARSTSSAVFAAVTGPALLAATGVALLADAEVVSTLSVVAVAATAVAVLIERFSAARYAVVAMSGCISAAIVAGLATLLPIGVALERIVEALAAASGYALLGDISEVLANSTEESIYSVSALAIIVVIIAAVWTSRPAGLPTRRRHLIVWSGVAVAILAIPLLSTLVGMVAGWLTIAVVATTALVRRHRMPNVETRRDFAPSSALIVLGTVSLSLGWLAAWANTTTWIAATLAAIVMLAVARLGTSNPAARATLLSAAALVLLIGAATTPTIISIIRTDIALDGIPGDATRLVATVAALLIGSVALPAAAARLSALDQRAMFWIGLGTTAGTWVLLQSGVTAVSTSATRDLQGITLALATLLLAALLLWLVSSRTTELRTERRATSIALAPAVYLVMNAFAALTGLTDGVDALVTAPVIAVTAALMTGVGSMLEVLMRPRSRMRGFREIGIGIVAVPATVGALSFGGEDVWLVLLFLAVTTLTLAISRDGLAGSASIRKHVGWLALALCTAAFWVRLGESDVGAVELYVLPLAGALLLVAASVQRTRPDPDAPAEPDAPARPAVAAITMVALLVGLLPISLASVSGEPSRALLVAGTSALLLLVASFLPITIAPLGAAREARMLLNAMALAGAIGVLVIGIGRAAALGAIGDPGLTFDGWLGFVLIVFVAAGFGLATRPASEAALASQALALVAISATALLEAGSILNDATTPLRAELSILVLCLIHVLAYFIAAPPFTRLVAWVAIALAGFVALVSIVVGAADPLEFATVPLALTLLATGGARMLTDSAARSWPWLGAGTGILLVPSLIATLGDRPLWRLVGLGVIGVAMLVIGLTRRLQAPFVTAAVVVTIHALATFSPQIRDVYESVEWWIWLIPGGILVIVLAARLEKRVADLKEVVRSIGALR